MQKLININSPPRPPYDPLRPESKNGLTASPTQTPSPGKEKPSPHTAKPDAISQTACQSPSPSGSIGWNQNMFNTPSPIKKLPSGTETFLVQDMSRPDLAPLMLFLMKEFAGSWAVSGSVALHMHAIRQDALNAMTRMPADVDIVMRSQKVDSLQEILRKNNHPSQIERSPFSDNPSTIRFNDLKVDVLRAGRGTFGNLADTVRIGGLPVLSLKQLIASKKAALRVAQEECMEVATQYEGDIRVLEILQQKQCDNERTSSAASRAALRNADPCENRAKRKIVFSGDNGADLPSG